VDSNASGTPMRGKNYNLGSGSKLQFFCWFGSLIEQVGDCTKQIANMGPDPKL